ncbi:competence/damage-inducible protein A [Rapidithrix thailandica]|uniref:CinA-like protein n=1 Tax=Rapidithrix thailandica TaxID=413964 RepID=A0AAW9S5H4_9BACT
MNTVSAEIITIGDEILYGQITDTNTQWISQQLDGIGIKTVRKTSVGDQREAILSALQEASQRAHIVLVTGGLGPTKDDITKQVFVEYFNSTLVFHQEVLDHVQSLFDKIGRKMSDLNKNQAYLPECAQVIPNQLGTAPGMWFEKEDCIYISMPGVPHEMKGLMNSCIIEKLQQKFQTPTILHRMVKTIGIPESTLSELLAPWEEQLPEHISLAYLPSLGQVKLRLSGVGEKAELLAQELDREVTTLTQIAEKYIYAYDNEEVEHIIGQLLKDQNASLATAESCTGGFIANKITNVPGCSVYYKGGIVSYSNEVKMSQLGIPEEMLKAHGAVSEEVAKTMAKQVRIKYGADFGISTTGIAGPDGGTPEKPVGTVWVGYSDANTTEAKLLHFPHTRQMNITLTYNALMNWLRKKLLKEE